MIENLNYSLINTLDCLRKTKFYIDEPRDDSRPKPIVVQNGIDMHKACELYVTGQEGWKEIVESTAFHAAYWYKVKPYIDNYVMHRLLQAEHKMYAKHHEVSLNGVIDLILNDKIIVDYKFTLKPWNDKKFESYRALQAWPYFFLYQENFKEDPVALDYVIVPLEGELSLWRVPFCQESTNEAKALWRVHWAKIESAFNFDEWPASPNKFRCRFCNFKEQCEDAIRD